MFVLDFRNNKYIHEALQGIQRKSITFFINRSKKETIECLDKKFDETCKENGKLDRNNEEDVKALKKNHCSYTKVKGNDSANYRRKC